jgi:hypothetical protein
MSIDCADGKTVEALILSDRIQHAGRPGESHFTCPKPLGLKLITRLLESSAGEESGAEPLYVFASERRRVRITVVRDALQKAC